MLVAELCLLIFFTYLAVYFRFQVFEIQPNIESLENLPLKAFVFSIAMVFSMIAMGQYQTPSPKGRHYLPVILQRTTISLILGSLGLLVVYYVFPKLLIGRGIFGYAIVSSLVGISLLRTIIYHTVDGKGLRRKVLILGAGDFALNILKFEKREPNSGFSRKVLSPSYASYTIHGFVRLGSEEVKIPEKFLLNVGDDLADYCNEYEIDEIVLALTDRRNNMPVDELLHCKLSNINVIDFVTFWEREKGMINF